MPKITTTPAEATPESTTPAPTAPETTETTTQVEETPVPATAKKTNKKNAAPVATPEKKGKAKAGPAVTAKAAPKATSPAAEKTPPGFRWTEKRVAIVKALRALKANGELNARSSEEIQAKAGEGITLNDVKHYLYKDNDLVTEGYSGCIKGREGVKGVGYFLTEKGRTVKLP